MVPLLGIKPNRRSRLQADQSHGVIDIPRPAENDENALMLAGVGTACQQFERASSKNDLGFQRHFALQPVDPNAIAEEMSTRRHRLGDRFLRTGLIFVCSGRIDHQT